MTQTVTIRLSDDQVAALGEAARAAAIPPATLAARLIEAGLDATDGPQPDGPLVLAVQDELAEAPPVQREVYLLLARQAERGAPRGAVELLGVMRRRAADQVAEYEELAAELRRELSVPVYSHCQECRKRLSRSERYGAKWTPPRNYQPDNPLAVDLEDRPPPPVIPHDSGWQTFDS